MAGWDYDEDYRRQLDRPPSWEDPIDIPAVNNWAPAALGSHDAINVEDSQSWRSTQSCNPDRPALLASPNPQALPNPRQVQREASCYRSVSGTSANYRDRPPPGFSSQYGFTNRDSFHSYHDANGWPSVRVRSSGEYNGYHNGNGIPKSDHRNGPPINRNRNGNNYADYQQSTSRDAYDYDGGNHRVHDMKPDSRNLNTISKERMEERFVGLRLKDTPGEDVEGNTDGPNGTGANCAINLNAYENIPVEVKGEGVPSPLASFAEMKCDDILQQNIKRCGYTQPTPVQKHAIPICMCGRDLMASAQTGSGKTAAFCLPIIASILHNRASTTRTLKNASCAPFALVLSPTRELACQIHTEAKKFAYETGLRVAVVYGGTPISVQINELHQGVDVLVATPGRLKDLLERRRVSLSQVKYLVLDEADRMLDMGFEPQIRCIVEEADMPVVDQRQTMLFSATFPCEIKELASKYLSNSIFLSVGRVGSSTDLILQKVEYLDEFNKRDRLLELVKLQPVNSSNGGQQLMIVFAQTKREVDSLHSWLCQMGYRATSIHGDRTQYERERALKSFRAGSKPILIATDVAARGLDVPDVSQVVNYDLPQEIESYVHRIGRTGRAGKMGTAIAFFCDKDISLAKPLIQLLKESKQQVPDWLLEYADMKRPNMHSHGRRRPNARKW